MYHSPVWGCGVWMMTLTAPGIAFVKSGLGQRWNPDEGEPLCRRAKSTVDSTHIRFHVSYARRRSEWRTRKTQQPFRPIMLKPGLFTCSASSTTDTTALTVTNCTVAILYYCGVVYFCDIIAPSQYFACELLSVHPFLAHGWNAALVHAANLTCATSRSPPPTMPTRTRTTR